MQTNVSLLNWDEYRKFNEAFIFTRVTIRYAFIIILMIAIADDNDDNDNADDNI